MVSCPHFSNPCPHQKKLPRFSGAKTVPNVGLEPTHVSIPHFECGASTNSANSALQQVLFYTVLGRKCYLAHNGVEITLIIFFRERLFMNDMTSLKARRILVVEDETLIRIDIIETLKEEGFEVVGEADNGEKAIELANELKPDLVLMDVKMPILDGISAAEKIIESRIAPVVLLTAFSQRELVERAKEAGAMAYLVKPFTPADLVPAIEIAISRYLEITALEDEVTNLSDKFETRKLVERAKSALMTKMGLSEPEAFRWIQKTSMDRRLSMREVAETVLNQVEKL